MRNAARIFGVAMAMAWVMAAAGCGGAEAPKPGAPATDVKPTGDAANPGDAPPSGEVKVGETVPPVTVTEKAPEPPDMKKVSYVIGLNMGKSAKQAEVAIDAGEMMAGLKAGLEGVTPRFTDEEIQKIMTAFQESMMAQQMAKAKKAAEEAKAKGDAYLADNAKKEGVKTTASGLQYRIIKTGAGKQPKTGDQVSVHYKGRLTDGTQFDSSYERNEPATFEVGGVIEGWNEALLLMHEGDTWEITIPAKLAYGERGAGPIPPNSVLVFDVELKKVEPPPAAPAPAPAPAPEAPK